MEAVLTERISIQTLRMDIPAAEPITLLPTSDIAFEQLFTSHFRRLFAYAITIVKDEMQAEEMVQNVFFKIWEKNGAVDIKTSVTAYLYRAVYNECLNYLKHKKVKQAYQTHATSQASYHTDNAGSRVQVAELQRKLNEALNDLPEQCRTIFQMSRFEEMKYQEIADRLGLSIKTVENQMGKALRILRTKLADYLPLILFIIEAVNAAELC